MRPARVRAPRLPGLLEWIGQHGVLAVPSLFAAAFVLTIYADFGLTLDGLPRPLLVAVLLAVALQVATGLLLRSARRGALVATGLLVTVVDIWLWLVVLAVLAAWLLARGSGRRLTTGPVAVVMLVFFTMAAGRVVTGEAFALADFSQGPGEIAVTPQDGPDIYLILLDGYPRSDTLAGYGYDNAWFEAELADRGFDLAPKAHSNYAYTSLVLTTMLHMRHVAEIEALRPVPETNVGQYRAIADAKREAPAIRFLQERGYWTRAGGLPATVGALRGTDEYVHDGYFTNFEHQVLARTAVWPHVRDTWALDQHRAQIRSVFDLAERTAAETSTRTQPILLLAHALSPHTPFVFDRNGDPAVLPCGIRCSPFGLHDWEIGLTPEQFGFAYGEQTHYLNGRTLEVVDRIIEASADAVVIVFSDHGARANEDTIDEWFTSFFAARTPGHPGLFEEDARPIEIFPRVFNAYFGEAFRIPDDISYLPVGRLRQPLALEPW